MSDTSKPFAFSQFVPGFDFLKNLASGSAAAGATPGMPSLASWVAPTLSVEEVDKRIQELKTVQFWLEQNGHALKATIQALEVQKMTLSTLRGMNVQMEDLASVFTRQAMAASEPAAAPAPKPEPKKAEPVVEAEEAEQAEEAEEAEAPATAKPSRRTRGNGGDAAAEEAGVVDPLQWWGALTQQFQQIASAALQEASQLKMPVIAQPATGAATRKAPAAKSAKQPASAESKASAGGQRAAAAGKTRAPARKRAR
ncbi:PhaM family polyhydroxyalkanoate granule multifunctional regulatory protein [Variovorax ureilyticus]|uniref:PhaM family polyhydroxyalkanoate granule multifunctional regulatory protein n=1 Tax=Variovorax ureilyticus TaxID=1836198 RepID=A0ABU8VF49_9BURK